MSVPPRKIERVALLDQVYEVLKERILDRAYQPEARLGIDALARELKVSSTPIREALGRLTAEGLVSAAPFVGFSVAPMPSHKYYLDLYSFRLIVEPWAAAETARRRPPEIMAALDAAVRVMTLEPLDPGYSGHRDFTQADEDFHLGIMAGAGNEPALKCFRDLRIHLHMSRLYIHRDQGPDIARAQHMAILAAIAAGDAERAAAEMSEHLLVSKRRLLD